MRSFQQWLEYIESLHPHAISPGLARMEILAERLGFTGFSQPVITVAGTNGKGSTVACLESIYRAGGYRTALYTSPHLIHFCERLRINSQNVSEEDFITAFEQVEVARGSETMTFFEFTTLAAFVLIAKADLDVIILEIGMGGRLDAVNFVDPTIAVITCIDCDHREWLGTTREAIASEKAGIIRSTIPVVCTDTSLPESVIARARALRAPLYQLGPDFHSEDDPSCPSTWTWSNSALKWESLPRPKILLSNAATALQVVHLLSDVLPVEVESIRHGLSTLYLRGRCEYFSGKPAVILDVAHNLHSVLQLRESLHAFSRGGALRAVFSVLSDKDYNDMISVMSNVVDEWHIAQNDSARSISLKELQKSLVESEQDYYSYNTVLEAYHCAKMQSKPDDLVIVFGSFYTVAAVLTELDSKESL